jgi:endonuclease YncB( thermonuclease family)
MLFYMAAGRGAEVISGEPRIIDGDTIQIATSKVRLTGIDAPEMDRICLDGNGGNWACGIAARDELIRFSAGRQWECGLVGVDKYGRSLGR